MAETPSDPENAAKSPQKGEDERFNPFRNEGDMFKIVVWAGAVCLALILIVFLVRAVF